MPAPAPHARWAAFAATVRRFALALAHPVVLTFVVAAYFSYVSADTVRAVYLLAVGLALAWDHARRAARRPSRAAGGGQPGPPDRFAVFSHESAQRRRAAMGRLLIPALLVGAGYSVLVS
jgi:hypothetical protein